MSFSPPTVVCHTTRDIAVIIGFVVLGVVLLISYLNTAKAAAVLAATTTANTNCSVQMLQIKAADALALKNQQTSDAAIATQLQGDIAALQRQNTSAAATQ